MAGMRRDRLRELLDAVLADGTGRRASMAGAAYSSEHHFSRAFRHGTRESPVAMRRRVLLERAAWRLRSGASVTEVAHSEGYASVEGFSRAFSRALGHQPRRLHRRPGPLPGVAPLAHERRARADGVRRVHRRDRGGGAPLLPRRVELRLEELAANGELACARYTVVRDPHPPG